MNRPLLRVLAGAVLAVGTFAGPTITSAATYGNCSTEDQYFAGEQAEGTRIRGIRATIDPTGSQNHLCTSPGLSFDNGVFLAVQIDANNGGSGGIASLGWVTCDFLASFCNAAGDRKGHRAFLSLVDCGWPFFDTQVDLGSIDYNPHRFTLLHYSTDNSWHVYIDGVLNGHTIQDSAYGCLDPDTNIVLGVYSAERLDLGDGWDVLFRGEEWMPYNTATWMNEIGGTSCDINNRTIHLGFQGCLVDYRVSDNLYTYVIQ